MIINPLTANIMNAVMCGLMSFGLLLTPQKFMQGGAYQKPWFPELPPERDNKLYYLGQFMSFIMLGGCLVPVLINPSSQLICYQMAFIHGVNIIHTMIFMCSKSYENARPKEFGSKAQWYFMTALSVAFFVVTVLASLHTTPDEVDSQETRLSKTVANSVMLAFSSTFGLLFTLIPGHLVSMFWDDESLPDDSKKFMGFKLLKLTDVEKWWTRCVGTAILCLNLGMAVDANIQNPLYTKGSLVTVSTLTLLNFHQVVMRPYKSISSRHIWLSWIPNLLMSGAVIGVLASAVLYV